MSVRVCGLCVEVQRLVCVHDDGAPGLADRCVDDAGRLDALRGGQGAFEKVSESSDSRHHPGTACYYPVASQ